MDSRETEMLLVRASAIDHRAVNDMIVVAWQEVLADVSYQDGVLALVEHRRSQPGVYLEPGHLVQALRVARQRHRELNGIHPPPPPGKRWAVQVIEDSENTTRALT
jgi:hypothetical protein